MRQLLLELEDHDREGAAAIAAALRSNTTITELHLGSSVIDEGVLAAINGTLRVNKFITTIGGSGGPPAADALTDAASEVGSPAARSLPAPAAPSTYQPTPVLPLAPPQPPPPSRSPQQPPPRSPQRSALVACTTPSLGAAMGGRSAPVASPALSSSQHAPSTGRKAGGGGGSRAANGGRLSADASDAPAMAGWNKRLEQLAAAMEVRLQAQEAHMIRLANELNTERNTSTELKARVEELDGKLAASASEQAALKGALEAERQQREQLAQELRWMDEAGARARA